jgi:hypothetical protein
MQGSPKKRIKKAASLNTETSMVVALSVMQFPYHEAVQNATHKKRQRKTTKVQKGNDLGSANTSNSVSNRYVYLLHVLV